MIRNRILLRSFALFFLLEFISSVFFPAISFALTAGPTAPEFTSFEPVDTTDIVNLATGDLVYNTPLLEIPGPEGGYPLSLSYHAGIKVDQEASWVGLGWTLNPGAINRSVNGFPDDNLESKRGVFDYWGGGEQVTKTFSLGFAIPKTGIGLNYSLARTTDTYKGFSSQSSVSFSLDPVNAAMSIAASLQATKLGGVPTAPTYGMKNVINTVGKLNNSLGNLGASSSMGVSIGSKGIKSFATVAGLTIGGNNSSAGHISSYTDVLDRGGMALLPFGGYFGLKDFYTRYWSDEGQSILTYGALYPGPANEKMNADHFASGPASEFTSYVFDTYDIYDEEPITEEDQNVANNKNDPTKQLGGSLPAFDRYEVLGQGIGGVIQPFIFENGDLYGQNAYLRGNLGAPGLTFPTLKYNSLKKFSNKKVDFRFLNDFSNSLSITTPTLNDLSLEAQTVEADPYGFNDTGRNLKLAGSRHIEWFTNDEIAKGVAKAKGFIDCYENSNDRKLSFNIYENYLQPEACIPYTGTVTYGKANGSFKTDSYDDPYEGLINTEFKSLKPTSVTLNNKIGGFMITNETGVTYHYSLPVYAYNEYTRSKLKNPRKGVSTFREYKNDEPYAYTWLLTAITGPDYVDQNSNSQLDDSDFGYWVKFDYGRWTDAYQWRTPHTGYTNDMESEYETFSYGIKELYYLDAVETRSHKAIFIKSKRKDGKGVTSRLEGGSNPRSYKMHYDSFGNLNFNVSPVSTMKLDAIYLFDKKDLQTLSISKARGERYNEAPSDNPHQYPYTGDPYTFTKSYANPPVSVTIKQGEDFIPVTYHNGKLVYDNDDIHDLPAFKAKALRVIEFDTDYHLSQKVPNSIDYFSKNSNSVCSDLESACSELSGRIGNDYEWPALTDNSSCFDPILGNSPVCCENVQSFYGFDGIFSRCNSSDGAAINWLKTGKLTLNKLKFLGKGGESIVPSTSFTYAKNPDYSPKRFDSWGFYKNDYNVLDETKNTTREITAVSSTDVDAWSLTEVVSPLGASIKFAYEANDYQKSVYNDFSLFSIEKIERTSTPGEAKITFKEKDLNLEKWFDVNDFVDVKAFGLNSYVYIYPPSSEIPEPETRVFEQVYTGAPTDVVNSIGDNFITLQSAGLLSVITSSQQCVEDPITHICGSVDNEPHFVCGFIKVDDVTTKYAGGVRVKSISVLNGESETSSVYSYNDDSGKSSGVTSFKPFNIPSIIFPPEYEFLDDILQDEDKLIQRRGLEKIVSDFQQYINEPIKALLANTREAPAPGVIYGNVTVQNFFKGQKLDNYQRYQFKVYNEDMISRERAEVTDNSGIDKRTLTINNKANDVGSLLSTKLFNLQDQLIKSIDYNYLYDDDLRLFEQEQSEAKQSLVEQSFHKYVTIKDYKVDGNDVQTLYTKQKALITKRRESANVVTSVKERNFLTGLITETQTKKFDFYSGAPIEVINFDSYGNQFLSVSEPAYKQYPQMGLKIFEPSNKHMLTQLTAQKTLVFDDEGNASGLMSASVDTWSDQIAVLNVSGAQENIWRKHASFSWNGNEELNPDGSFKLDEFENNPFDRGTLATNSRWQKNAELTLYDPYSHILESKDVNGNAGAIKYDNSNSKIIASGVNAAYYEIGFSGAEDYSENPTYEGGVNVGQGVQTNATAHSGESSLLVTPGNSGFTFTTAQANLAKKYKASVWVYAPGYSETQTELDKIELYCNAGGVETKVHPVLNKSKAKSWYLLNLDINPGGAEGISVSVRNNSTRGVYFDDFRVHPLNASLTSYVYDQSTGELTYILDGNNLYTKFEYDAMGRLIRTSRELLNFDFGPGKETYRADAILGEYKYNFGKE
jgi:hypothetical protein